MLSIERRTGFAAKQHNNHILRAKFFCFVRFCIEFDWSMDHTPRHTLFGVHLQVDNHAAHDLIRIDLLQINRFAKIDYRRSDRE